MCDANILEALKNAIVREEKLTTSTIHLDTDATKGVGLAGLISHIKVRGITADGEDKTIHLVFKAAPNVDLIRKAMPAAKMYEAEVYAYTKVLPTFRQICGNFIKTPTCRLTSLQVGAEYLVLEDLSVEGYRLHKCNETMDGIHIRLVFDACAKFHAVSLVLKNKNIELWNELVSGINRVSDEFFGKTGFCDGVRDYAKLLDVIFDPVKEKGVAERFAKFRDNDLKKFMAETCCGHDSNFVLAHGDLWCNNVLFKYEDEIDLNNPTDTSFIDWQALRISSVAIDLSYFFYICASRQAMNNVDDYLKFYHRRLSKYLAEYGVEADTAFSFEVFDQQWRKYNKFGLTMCLVVLHAITCEVEEIPSYEDMLKSGLGFWQALNFESKNQHIYHKRIKDVIEHFVEKKYL